jgi:hypothetical protein
MKYVHSKYDEYINRMFSLPARGDEQDWDIELADPDRVEEFLSRYPEIERTDELSFALMSLIVASFDEKVWVRFLEVGKPLDFDWDFKDLVRMSGYEVDALYTAREKELWSRISAILAQKPDLFDGIISYWSLDDNDSDHCWPSTLFFWTSFPARDWPRPVPPDDRFAR